MQTLFRFFLASMATWRLSFLLARQDGPWQILARFRKSLYAGFYSELFKCVKCMSVWVAIPFAFFVGGDWKEILVIWLALSGVSALIDEWLKPPFEWQEDKGNELLRTKQDSTSD